MSDGTDGTDELLPFGVTARRGRRVLRCCVAVNVSSSEDRRARPGPLGPLGARFMSPRGHVARRPAMRCNRMDERQADNPSGQLARPMPVGLAVVADDPLGGQT